MKEAFNITDRGFNVKAFYLDDDSGNAQIKITCDGKPFREFLYPAYKIWNIAAHFNDLVDEELCAK